MNLIAVVMGSSNNCDRFRRTLVDVTGDIAGQEMEQRMVMDAGIDQSLVAVLHDDVGGAALERLSHMFVEECEKNHAEMVHFLKADNLHDAEIVAHRFKSTARQFGALGLSDVCHKLEQACAEGQGEQAAAFIEILAANIPQICINLEKATASACGNS